MALFGKKSSDGSTSPASTSTASAPKKSRGFGRKKDDAVPPTPAPGAAAGTEDFSDFSQPGDTGGATAQPPTPAAQAGRRGNRARSLKNGTSLGINIGSDSIKAVELQAKGGEVSITGVGIIPTPAESINNGVITSIAALQHAIRDLCKQAGIKSKRVTLSVAGTGALVVRVIEVPKMSDAELADNMQVDADRYIPFPPSEVIMDFKALRELPSDPDAANMDVLLAAAQREIIDSHVKVIEEAKLDPRAIEVEPLAAARALTFRGSSGLNSEVNYNDVSAIINIGATGTEISVLRGDILVFTRTVPNGGNTLTQQLVDYLGLPWHDAERVKLDWGDALPPHVVAGQAPVDTQAAAATHDDWSEFGAFDEAPAAATPAAATADTSTILDADFDPNTPNPPASSDASGTNDPFDLDFFNQGPTNDEPKSQHGQKEEDKPAFDFSSFQFSDEEETTPPATPAPTDSSTTEPAAEAAGTTPDAGDTTEASSSVFDFGFPSDEPATAETPAMEEATAASTSDFSFSEPAADAPAAEPATAPAVDFNLADFNLADEPPATEATSTATTGILPDEEASAATGAAPFSLEKPAEPDATPAADATTTGATTDTNEESAWSLDKFDEPAAATATSAATAAPDATASPDAPAAGNDDFDLDSFFTDVPDPATNAEEFGPTDAALAGVAGAGVAGAAAAAGVGVAGAAAAAGVGGAVSLDKNDFGTDFGGFNDDLSDFGAGLSGATPGVDAATVHSILHPVIDELSGEIRRSLEYHASRYPDAVVQHITLIGGGARLKNIDAYFTQTLGIPTTLGNPLTNIAVRTPNLPDGYAAQNAPIFAVALGLALRDLII